MSFISGLLGGFARSMDMLSGAIDIVVVKQQDGSFKCSPFHVKFGSLKLITSSEKTVRIMINGILTEVTMRVGENGEAYFCIDKEDTSSDHGSPLSLSPPQRLSEMDRHVDNIDISEFDFQSPRVVVPLFDKEEIKPEFFKTTMISPRDAEAKGWSWANWFGYRDDLPKNDFVEQEFRETLEKSYGNNDTTEKNIVKLKSLLSDEKDEGIETSLRKSKMTVAIEIPIRKNINSPMTQPVNLTEKNVDIDFVGSIDKLTVCLPETLSGRSSPCGSPILIGKTSPVRQISPERVPEKKETKSRWNWLWAAPQEELFTRSLRPSSDELAKLHLKFGKNEIKFFVSSRVQGPQEVVAHIYMWNYDTQLVISDVDGTITRSDVFGHILPMIGKDWSHSGIAQLYSDIQKNGYVIFYLTSRSILQASQTRGYINSVKQDEFYLPEGPIISNPEKLFECLAREVITKNPEEFKIGALREIKSLFPTGSNPFYAGFGNKINDLISYKTVGVSLDKIFTINTSGVVKVNMSVQHKSYTQLRELVQHIFPDVSKKRDPIKKEFTSFSYWKAPIASVDDLTEM